MAGAVVGLAVGAHFLAPRVETALNTVSTDDAYVNGHVTLVAPRVPGQVMKVFVDDNCRVKKGALLVQLDKEPYGIQVAIKKAAVVSAEADMVAANPLARALVAAARANRFMLQHAIEDVNTQTALLRARVAALKSKEATFERARADLSRAQALFNRAAIAREEFDQRREAEHVADALAHQALEEVFETRVALGLPPRPEKGELSDVPDDLDQNFSTVRQNLGMLIQNWAQLGVSPTTWEATPKQALEDLYKLDPKGNLDRLIARNLSNAPAVKQAEANLLQARSSSTKAC